MMNMFSANLSYLSALVFVKLKKNVDIECDCFVIGSSKAE